MPVRSSQTEFATFRESYQKKYQPLDLDINLSVTCPLEDSYYTLHFSGAASSFIGVK